MHCGSTTCPVFGTVAAFTGVNTAAMLRFSLPRSNGRGSLLACCERSMSRQPPVCSFLCTICFGRSDLPGSGMADDQSGWYPLIGEATG